MKRFQSFLLAGVLATTGAASQAADFNTWTQWRGAARDGQFHGPAWPGTLSGLKLKWRTEIGPGYSGPIVSESAIFTVETEDKEREVVRAFDRATGKQVWENSWEGAMKVPFYARGNGSWTRSTPTLNDGALYVAGMRDVMVCLDAATGKVRWRVDFAERHQRPIPQFGFVCSPLVDGTAVYAQAADSLVKINKHTGAAIWRALPEEKDKSRSAYSSPILATLHGKQQLIAQTREILASVDPQTGKELWSIPVKSSHDQNILTPVAYGNAIFTSSYGGRAQLLQVDFKNGIWSVESVWNNKLQGYMSSPVIVNGHAYLHLRNNRLSCTDLATGDIAWTSDEKFTNYASLVANGDRILALDSDGELHLIQADPTALQILDSREIADAETWAHLTVAGNQVIIREQEAIAVFEW